MWLLKYILLVLVLLGVGIFFLFITVFSNISKDLENASYNGTIIHIDSIRACFTGIRINETKDTTILEAEYCDPANDSFFNFIEIGDTLVKKRGELKVLIPKHRNGKRQVFDYPMALK